MFAILGFGEHSSGKSFSLCSEIGLVRSLVDVPIAMEGKLQEGAISFSS